MNKIEKLLSIGDLRSIGKSEEVVKKVSMNPRLFGDVVNAILVDSPDLSRQPIFDASSS